MGLHLSLLPLQVSVEAHGEGHDQHLQVTNDTLDMLFPDYNSA